MKPTQTLPLLLACGAALLTSSALANSPEKKLDRLDTNNDGQVSRSEYTAGIQQMFSELDTNNDGVVTAAEAEAGGKDNPHNGTTYSDETRGNPDRPERIGRERFKDLDQNGDGRVTLQEVSSGCNATFDKLDTNHDGVLSREELAGDRNKMRNPTHQTPAP